MIVVSDGSVIKNEIQRSNHQAYPMGMNVDDCRLFGQNNQAYCNTYGNQNFILNCMNYLCDDSGLLQVRTREVKLRLLDKKKVKLARVKWQWINTVLPIVLVALFGGILYFIRRRKYAV